jgi:hypothetical protein
MTTTTRTNRPASVPQINFLRDLLAERQPEQLSLLDRLLADERLNTLMASEKINYLKTLPKIAQTVSSRPATERQTEYVIDLLESRVHDLDAEAEIAGLTFTRAREIIELLKAAKKSTKAWHGLISGYYAVPDPSDPSTTLFRKVDTKGRVWIISGPNHLPADRTDQAIPLIQVDPKFAAAHYGQVIGRCGRCHTRLTDKESRDIGLGPVCRKRSW